MEQKAKSRDHGVDNMCFSHVHIISASQFQQPRVFPFTGDFYIYLFMYLFIYLFIHFFIHLYTERHKPQIMLG